MRPVFPAPHTDESQTLEGGSDPRDSPVSNLGGFSCRLYLVTHRVNAA